MVDIKHDEITEPTLPSKRKAAIDPEIDDDAKKPKLESPEQKALHYEHANTIANVAAAAAAAAYDEADVADKVKEAGKELNGGDEDDEEEVVVAAIDRKGKGIMAADKGKGKLIEEDGDSGDEDDDTTSDDDSEFEDDSDLSDDSLAELDPENILPATTRRKVFLPDCPRFNESHANDDSDNDSSDA